MIFDKSKTRSIRVQVKYIMETIYLVTEEDKFPGRDNPLALTHRFAQDYCKQTGQSFEVLSPSDALFLVGKIRLIIDRTLCYTQEIPNLHNSLAQNQARYLNPPEIMGKVCSKIALYENLGDFEEYLIPSMVIKDCSDFIDFVRSNVQQRVVLKPEYGSMGNNVFFVTVLSADKVQVIWKNESGSRQEVTKEAKEFFDKFVDSSTDENSDAVSQKRWLGQSFMDFTKVDNAPVDIRIVRQAISEKKKTTSLMHGRQSVGDVPVTNLDKGGNVISIQDAISSTSIQVEEILELCENIENSLERNGDVIGEIGHDFGIAEGKLIYIEGNTMPGYVYKNWATILQNTTGYPFDALEECDKQLISNPIKFLSQVGCSKPGTAKNPGLK